MGTLSHLMFRQQRTNRIMTKGILYYYSIFAFRKIRWILHLHIEKYSDNAPYRNDLCNIQPSINHLKSC